VDDRIRWKDLASYLIRKGISEPKTTIIFDSFVFLEKKGYVDNGIEDYDQGITRLSSVSLTEKGKRILSELNLNESREGRAVVRSRDSSTCWVADAFLF
jgi:hypothetical protein